MSKDERIYKTTLLSPAEKKELFEKAFSDTDPRNIVFVKSMLICPRCKRKASGSEGNRIELLIEDGIVVGALCEKCNYSFALGDKEV